jgi:hypothetical protein
MRTISLLAALALAAAMLAAVPSAQALEMPPQCQTMGASCCGIEPGFAPCCNVLTCPPPVARCPTTQLRTSDVLAYLGPHATVETGSDCHADACVDSSVCAAAACDPGALCCTVDGAQSACTAIGQPTVCSSPPVPILMASAQAAVALPLPQVGYHVEDDCSLTVTETYDCPNGFWDAQAYRDLGPVQATLGYCVPMCKCMPLETAALPEVLA